MKSRLKFALATLVVGAVSTFGVASSNAAIVERVVAVVGERPVFLSELRHRARPYLVRILMGAPSPAQQAAAETEMYRDLLNRMIDDRLEETAADKAHLGVSVDEIDNAIKNIAGSAHLAVKDLVGEAKRQGLSEQDYRDEIRRQVLEGKLVQLRVRGRVRVTDQDARAAYGRWVKEMGNQAPLDVRILALRLPQGGAKDALDERLRLADEIAARGKKGEDFCQLVASYSEDTQTKATCGSRGPQPMSALLPALQDALQGMHAGDVSDPVRVENEAVLVLQLVNDPKVPGFDDVKDSMTERAFSEAMDRQRKMWLQEMRRGVYVDVRL